MSRKGRRDMWHAAISSPRLVAPAAEAGSFFAGGVGTTGSRALPGCDGARGGLTQP
jgi:hypothetical protein